MATQHPELHKSSVTLYLFAESRKQIVCVWVYVCVWETDMALYYSEVENGHVNSSLVLLWNSF